MLLYKKLLLTTFGTTLVNVSCEVSGKRRDESGLLGRISANRGFVSSTLDIPGWFVIFFRKILGAVP